MQTAKKKKKSTHKSAQSKEARKGAGKKKEGGEKGGDSKKKGKKNPHPQEKKSRPPGTKEKEGVNLTVRAPTSQGGKVWGRERESKITKNRKAGEGGSVKQKKKR